MFFRKMALLAKIETVYDTDSVPTGVANAILARNVTITPLEVEAEDRAILQPYLGNSGQVVTDFYGKIEFEVELSGAGAAGTVPKYGPLLRGCALAEVISAGVSVTYTPVSTGFESLTTYFYLDGVLHKFTGARGSVKAALTSKGIPVFKFMFTGNFQAVADAALPAVTYGQTFPLAVNKANTPTFTLHAYSAVMQSLEVDLGNEVKRRNLVNYAGVDNIDRSPVGTVAFESTLVATKAWFDIAKNLTTGALNIVHGTTAGNIVQIQAPNVQIVGPKYTEQDGIVMLSASLNFMPGASGNDELSIVVK